MLFRSTYDDWETEREEILHFRGPVHFDGLRIEGPGDLTSLLVAGFDPVSQEAWTLGPVETTPDGRRRACAELRGFERP